MELDEIVRVASNLYNHFYLKRKTELTNDEFRLCQELLKHNINLEMLFKALLIIKREADRFGNLIISKRAKNNSSS